MCQVKEKAKAANAAYTHLVHNPGDEIMTANLNYYLANGVGRESLKNLEMEVNITKQPLLHTVQYSN